MIPRTTSPAAPANAMANFEESRCGGVGRKYLPTSSARFGSWNRGIVR
jgi:hypothetical protein